MDLEEEDGLLLLKLSLRYWGSQTIMTPPYPHNHKFIVGPHLEMCKSIFTKAIMELWLILLMYYIVSYMLLIMTCADLTLCWNVSFCDASKLLILSIFLFHLYIFWSIFMGPMKGDYGDYWYNHGMWPIVLA